MVESAVREEPNGPPRKRLIFIPGRAVRPSFCAPAGSRKSTPQR